MNRKEVKQYMKKVYETVYSKSQIEDVDETIKVSNYIIDQEFDKGKTSEDIAVEGVKYFIESVISDTQKIIDLEEEKK
jgi:hypothetical protein